MKRYRVGKIINTHGLKGDVKVYPYTDDISRFEDIKYVYFNNDEEKIDILNVKYNKNTLILKLKGIDSIELAEKILDTILYIDSDNLRELEEDEYMISDLVGLEVYSSDNDYIGVISNVLQYTANDIYVVNTKDNKEILIPCVKEFISKISLSDKKVVINVIEGLID